jgi:cellulose synthase/poly-beta-1,6-N-acetylglucosamine synthase-like glycosyltransferase
VISLVYSHYESSLGALSAIYYMALIINCLLVISSAVFFIEIVLAIIATNSSSRESGQFTRPRIAVVVPAHNESTGVIPTLADVSNQLLAGDRLLLIADNCNDDTAAVASAVGAEVTERINHSKVGKGYALEWGICHIAADPPDIVIMIDADSRLEPHALDRLSYAVVTTGRPVQALYLMTSPEVSSINFQVAEFGWRVKNWLRPLGRSVLNLPCQLAGSGMAFPWDVIRTAAVGNGNIVEDLHLGIELAMGGHKPLFCPSAKVTSQFAASRRGAETQRGRWEQGHLRMIVSSAATLVMRSIVQRDWHLLAMALDLAILPLTLLASSIFIMFIISLCFAMTGFSSVIAWLNGVSLIVFAAAILLAWLKCGKDILPLHEILKISSYVLWKFKLYMKMLGSKNKVEWIRTERK